MVEPVRDRGEGTGRYGIVSAHAGEHLAGRGPNSSILCVVHPGVVAFQDDASIRAGDFHRPIPTSAVHHDVFNSETVTDLLTQRLGTGGQEALGVQCRSDNGYRYHNYCSFSSTKLPSTRPSSQLS